jgi:hypothetical protein
VSAVKGLIKAILNLKMKAAKNTLSIKIPGGTKAIPKKSSAKNKIASKKASMKRTLTKKNATKKKVGKATATKRK